MNNKEEKYDYEPLHVTQHRETTQKEQRLAQEKEEDSCLNRKSEESDTKKVVVDLGQNEPSEAELEETRLLNQGCGIGGYINSLELLRSVAPFNSKGRIQKMIDLGILYDENTAGIRENNGGKSNYACRIIQPWAIYEENPQLNYLECDIIKRLLRTKEEYGMTMLESRMLDIQKIKHIVTELERVYTIELNKQKKK